MKSQYSSMFPTVEVKRLNPDAPMPQFARDGDAGCDLCTMDEVEIEPHETRMVHSGIAVSIPRGFEGTLRPRSVMASKRGITLANAPSTIDSNYRGEVLLPLHNMTDEQRKRIHEITYSTQDCMELAERIVALEDENAKLRDTTYAWRTVDRLSCENAKLREKVMQLKDDWESERDYADQMEAKEKKAVGENDKLREMVDGLTWCCEHYSCRQECPLYDVSEPDHCREVSIKRELGIEVD